MVFVINGQCAGDYSGYSVSFAGDVNGDGLNDLVIGAYGNDLAAGANAGRSYVVFGKTGCTAINLSAVAAGSGGFVINGQCAGETNFLPKVYQPIAGGPGNLGLASTAGELSLKTLVPPSAPGEFAVEDTTATKPIYLESGAGVTLDSTAVATDRLAVASRDFYPGSDPGLPSYVRVDPGRQYIVRFHITSTQQSNRNAQMRLRARSAKFAWSQKFEIGGAWGAGSRNNAIAQQALPGIGCQNPERDANEAGGWYNLLMQTPLNPDIRPEFPAGTPLATRMPLLSGQPGTGIVAPSRRDLRVGFDLIDTLSADPNHVLEAGNFTIDRIEVRSMPQVGD